MRTLGALLSLTMASAVLAAACGGDDPPVGPGGSGGTGGSAGSGGTGGTGGGSGGDGASGGSGGSPDGSAGTSGAAGTDGGTPDGGKFQPYPEVPFPTENPFTEEKALLGKILFWDEQMGGDNTMACGTCHRGSAGGSDPRLPTAARHPGADGQLGTADDIHGAMGVKRCTDVGGNITYKSDTVFGAGVQVTGRRPPSYLDAMFALDIFWDGRATRQFTDPDTQQVAIVSGGALESQAVGPPLSDAEMACEGRTWPMIHQKLQGAQPLALAQAGSIPAEIREHLALHPTYPALFAAAFGTPEINTKRIAFAIATHERRLKSDQTPWDKWNAGDDSAMTEAQVRGFELFMDKGKCNQCHTVPLFTDGLFHNLGFVEITDFDTGRQFITGDVAHRGQVKTQTLRNVGLREAGGLLHYGFGPGADLPAVMAAYNNPPMLESTDQIIVDNSALGLTTAEIADITDFMRNALTDPRVAAEAPPFDRPKLSTEP